MAQPITLINPKGERRDFGFVEFYGFKQQVANSQSFKFWADVKGLPGWFKHNGETRLNVPVVASEVFLCGMKGEGNQQAAPAQSNSTAAPTPTSSDNPADDLPF